MSQTTTMSTANSIVPERADYQRGWRDCRAYAGDGSAAYKRGFADCLRAYHDAGRWVELADLLELADQHQLVLRLASQRPCSIEPALLNAGLQGESGQITPLGLQALRLVSFLPSGNPDLDAILGGGLARHRVVEIYALPGVPRSRLQGLVPCLGGAPVCNEDNVEEALQAAPDLLVLHLQPLVEGCLPVMQRAQRHLVRRLASAAARYTTVIVHTLPTKPVAAVSNALKFFASQRVEVRTVDEGLQVRVVKNKLAPPFQSYMVADRG